MKRELQLMCLVLVAVVFAGLFGCSHKPAYSEMDTNKSSRNQNQNQNQTSEGQAAAPVQPAPQPAADAAQTAPSTPAPFKTPTFLDQASGGIKDLPTYPNAARVSVQLGPIEGVNTMSLIYVTGDPMDKIAAFYTRVIKDQKWTVSDKILDPELSEWTLKKGEDNSAKVQVKKDQKTGAFNIVMVRGEQMQAPKK
jgi:hypothetical protein